MNDTPAFRSALISVALGAACFNPDDNQPLVGDTGTQGTSDGADEESPTTDAGEATDDPSTVDGSGTTDGDGGSTTGACTVEACPCAEDRECDDGLVCRDSSCQPLVCGDAMIEGTEL